MRLALLLLVGCVTAPTGSETTAPLVGVDGSKDQADRSCNIVLRDLEPSHGTYGGWIEISNAAAAEGLQPAVLYKSTGDWIEVQTIPSTSTATTGYTRFNLAIPTSAAIQVVPFMHLAGGGRLFDHNRNPGETDNYVLGAPDFAIWQDPTVCAPPTGPTSANLVFDADFTQHRDGMLAPGGNVSIRYAKARLSQCASTQGGLPQYGITAWVKFLPGNQLTGVSVLDTVPTLAVPSDARSVQVWFESNDVHGCHVWDSNNNANYAFDLAVAPQWIGNGTSLFSRDTSSTCGTAPISSGFTYDTWVRERAAITNTCFEVYQPGMTDHDDPDLWQKLDVEIHVLTAPNTFSTYPVNFSSRQGNNARYAFDWRDVDPFRDYFCTTLPITPTSDGMYEQTQVEYFITVNGGEYRPEPGANFAGTFIDYPNATDAFCMH